jgi:hypothetical protein
MKEVQYLCIPLVKPGRPLSALLSLATIPIFIELITPPVISHLLRSWHVDDAAQQHALSHPDITDLLSYRHLLKRSILAHELGLISDCEPIEQSLCSAAVEQIKSTECAAKAIANRRCLAEETAVMWFEHTSYVKPRELCEVSRHVLCTPKVLIRSFLDGARIWTVEATRYGPQRSGTKPIFGNAKRA